MSWLSSGVNLVVSAVAVVAAVADIVERVDFAVAVGVVVVLIDVDDTMWVSAMFANVAGSHAGCCVVVLLFAVDAFGCYVAVAVGGGVVVAVYRPYLHPLNHRHHRRPHLLRPRRLRLRQRRYSHLMVSPIHHHHHGPNYYGIHIGCPRREYRKYMSCLNCQAYFSLEFVCTKHHCIF